MASALTAMTGTWRVRGWSRRCCSRAKPSMPGSWMSSSTRSGGDVVASARPWAGSLAVRSSSPGRRSNIDSINSRLTGLSSMYSTTGSLAGSATPRPSGGAGRGRAADASGGASAGGNCTQKVLPRPGWLCTPMSPPMARTRPRLSARPRPVPSTWLASAPSRSKAPNRRACWAASRPGPVSCTLMRQPALPGAPPAFARPWQATVTRPCGWLYLMALPSRFSSTCFSRTGSACTAAPSGRAWAATGSWMPRLRASGCSSDSASASTAASATGCGWIGRLPDSTTARSSTSLISCSRCRAPPRISSICWRCAGLSGCAVSVASRWPKPRMAFRGVRSSCDMLDRN